MSNNYDFTKLTNTELKKVMKKYLVDLQFPEFHKTTILALKQEYNARKKAGTWK
jgi:hypothetical protein